ncbi:MAG: hypothetical protein ABEJ40_00895 [Haloarculaceae archaeon]
MPTPANIRRRKNVEQSEKTEERTRAADWIEENVIGEVELPIQYTELERMAIEDLGEENAWSRQHFTNVIKWYFESVDDGENSGIEDQDNESAIVESDIKRELDAQIDATNESMSDFPASAINPEGYDTRSYLRGFADGYEAALHHEGNR